MTYYKDIKQQWFQKLSSEEKEKFRKETFSAGRIRTTGNDDFLNM